jgi:crossover junction endodeoxyribonuclease RuvC
MEFLQLNELILSKYDDHYTKLKVIFERTIELIETHHPDEIAIERRFSERTCNRCSSSGAQGVAMAAGLSRQIPITEYEPKKIKMAITGNGNASKEQVAKMLQHFGIENFPKILTVPGLRSGLPFFQFGAKSLARKLSWLGRVCETR